MRYRAPAMAALRQVDQTEESTERARQLGASVLLAPREGPAG